MTATAAPGELERVRQLINTRDIEAGTDRLGDAADLTAWLAEQGYNERGYSASAADLRRVTRLRECLRVACATNHDQAPMPEATGRTLTAIARRAGLGITIGGERGWSVSSRESGLTGYIGSVLATVVTAMSDGTWARLRVCRYDGCQWAFYDSSRARTRAWCSMGACGNRVKQARWRERSGH